MVDKDEFNDEMLVWFLDEFILKSEFKNFWLSFDCNKQKFKKCFCKFDGKVGYDLLERQSIENAKSKYNSIESFWTNIDALRTENLKPSEWDNNNWDYYLEEKNVGKNEIVAGNPARVIDKRNI